MKKQVIVVHGGDSFKNRRAYLLFLENWKIDFGRYKTRGGNWKAGLGKALGKKFEVVMPDMPSKNNAKYPEWKIWFEKFIPYFGPRVILVGHSLGGLFLAKYLSENRLSKTIRAVLLVSPPWNEGDFKLGKNLERLTRQGGKIFIYHSKDDPVVPFADLEKYRVALRGAIIRTFKNRGHFNQEKFPELIKDIKKAA